MGGQWLPQTWEPYVVAVTIAVVFLVLEFLGHQAKTRITADILENCDPPSLKDAAKSVWTNLGVTAALMLSIVAAMMQGDPLEPRFEVDDEMLDNVKYIDQAYFALCYVSMWHCSNAVLSCLINLVYVEPLLPVDSIKYFIAYPMSLGTPTVHVGKATFFMFSAVSMWTLGTHGLLLFIMSAIMTIVFTWWMYDYSKVRSHFTPKDVDQWAWTQKEHSAMLEDPHFQELVGDVDCKTLEIFGELGGYIHTGARGGA